MEDHLLPDSHFHVNQYSLPSPAREEKRLQCNLSIDALPGRTARSTYSKWVPHEFRVACEDVGSALNTGNIGEIVEG
jgi:hypothetical protein